ARTMQGPPARNAGFSSADFAQLYLPPLMDPVYGFQAVNVEQQRRDPSSFLHWIRRTLAIRKQHPVLATGELEVLHAENPSVLAYLRRRTLDGPAQDGDRAGTPRSARQSAQDAAERVATRGADQKTR